MSYDLTLLHVPPGADPLAVALARLEAEPPPPRLEPAAAQRRAQRLVAALQATDATLSVRWSEGSPATHPLAIIQGTDQSGIDILIFAETAALKIPYWHSGARAEAIFATLWRYLHALQQASTDAIYDPQLHRILNLATDRSLVRKTYGETVQRLRAYATAPKDTPQ